MRYTLTILLLLLAFIGKAQVIHFDSSANMSYVNIVPVKVKFSDTVLCTRMYIKLLEDNLNSECSLSYELRDDMGNTHIRDIGRITGEDYTSWDGNNAFPFEYEAEVLGLTTID
jgi:hypothetical protein